MSFMLWRKWKGFVKWIIWDKVFKNGLSKFFKGCLPQNLLSPLLHTLSQILGSKIELLIFHLLDGRDIDNSDDELLWTKDRRLQHIKTSSKETNGSFWRYNSLKKHIFGSNTETREEIISDRYSSWVVYFHLWSALASKLI